MLIHPLQNDIIGISEVLHVESGVGWKMGGSSCQSVEGRVIFEVWGRVAYYTSCVEWTIVFSMYLEWFCSKLWHMPTPHQNMFHCHIHQTGSTCSHLRGTSFYTGCSSVDEICQVMRHVWREVCFGGDMKITPADSNSWESVLYSVSVWLQSLSICHQVSIFTKMHSLIL